MSKIKFETKLFKIKDWTILRLPEEESAKLPSRSMTMVEGTLNDTPFKTLLEPDGRYFPEKRSSHWMRIKDKLQKEANIKSGQTIDVEIEPTKDWVEPEVPPDIRKALSTSQKAEEVWKDITPNARWDWVRWVRAVKTEETRGKHIQVMMDKLNKGMRRPCCFNRNLCSEPYVSKNWVLLKTS